MTKHKTEWFYGHHSRFEYSSESRGVLTLVHVGTRKLTEEELDPLKLNKWNTHMFVFPQFEARHWRIAAAYLRAMARLQGFKWYCMVLSDSDKASKRLFSRTNWLLTH